MNEQEQLKMLSQVVVKVDPYLALCWRNYLWHYGLNDKGTLVSQEEDSQVLTVEEQMAIFCEVRQFYFDSGISDATIEHKLRTLPEMIVLGDSNFEQPHFIEQMPEMLQTNFYDHYQYGYYSEKWKHKHCESLRKRKRK